ncbi:MAG: hypothetical protein Q4F72_10545, partial [Desulfovibrionaceae bacterium]|nr:hypothetical protein [Desulfovibrionaceae bacterium]
MSRYPWFPYEGGSTIGTEGTEDGGIIIQDDCYEIGARVILEECPDSWWAVTCGIIDGFVLTSFARSLEEAQEMVRGMEEELARLLDGWEDGESIDIGATFDRFV